jgi:putative oxidoreductase
VANDSDYRTSTSTSDLGLIVLRLGTGATMIQAGLIKALDFDTTVGFMETAGWRPPRLAAAMITATETTCGVALILGALTPLAACGILAAMLCAWAVNVSGSAFWSEPFNVPFLVAVAALALLLTGGGSYSLDERVWGWAQWPKLLTMALLALAVAAAVAAWVTLNGTNPIHFAAPTG